LPADAKETATIAENAMREIILILVLQWIFCEAKIKIESLTFKLSLNIFRFF
jgi:hypothetical protein